MQRLEVSGAVGLIYRSLGVKGLIKLHISQVGYQNSYIRSSKYNLHIQEKVIRFLHLFPHRCSTYHTQIVNYVT